MKKIIVLLAIATIAFVSCSPEKAENDARINEIKENIKKNKDEINKLHKEIVNLEEELEGLEPDVGNKPLVSVEKIKLKTFNSYIEVKGSVEAIKEAFISPETGGRIQKIYVKEGDRVRKGQLLAKVNPSITVNTINEVKESLAYATTIFEKRKRLYDKGIGSELEYLTAKNNKESLENKIKTLEAQLAMSMVRSPIYGIVDKINQKEGELASPGAMLMLVVNLQNLYINADVSEKYIANVKKGEKVQLSFPSIDGSDQEVPIYRVGNVIDNQNRTFPIQLKISNNKDKIKPNAYSNIRINDFRMDSCIVVKSDIVKHDISKGSYVYILDKKNGKDKVVKVKVNVEKTYNNESWVSGALNVDDEVVVEGIKLISHNVEVNVNRKK